MEKVALVTRGNQGLGFALVKGLCRTLTRTDFVYLTARNSEKGQAARESLGSVVPHLEYEQLDVTDEDSVARLTDILRTRLCLQAPTRGMMEEAVKAGVYEYQGKSYACLQIRTIEELLTEKGFDTPSQVQTLN